MTDDIIDMEAHLESVSLLPNRYYIILRERDDDTFSMAAYATAPITTDPDEEYFTPAGVAQLGLITILRENADYVFEKGFEALEHQNLAEAMFDASDPDSEVARAAKEYIDSNVVKVDFGRKQ